MQIISRFITIFIERFCRWFLVVGVARVLQAYTLPGCSFGNTFFFLFLFQINHDRLEDIDRIQMRIFWVMSSLRTYIFDDVPWYIGYHLSTLIFIYVIKGGLQSKRIFNTTNKFIHCIIDQELIGKELFFHRYIENMDYKM